MSILAEVTAVRHGVDLATIGRKESKQAAPDGNQQACVAVHRG